jgi:hypothetical protein
MMQSIISLELIIYVQTNHNLNMFNSIILFPCLQCTMKMKDQFYWTFHILWMLTLQISKNLTYLIFLAMWCKLEEMFRFHINWAKILRSCVIIGCMLIALFITCPKHAPSNGVYKLNVSHEITNFRVMVMLWYLHLSHNTRFLKQDNFFQARLQLPCQPMFNDIINIKKGYRNMTMLPICK